MRNARPLLAGALVLAALSGLGAQTVELPPTPQLSPEGFNLIVYYEVGGEDYYHRFLQRPEWPGLSSGVTIGVGYDLSTVSQPVILSDWVQVPQPNLGRLTATQPYHGPPAKAQAQALQDILIAWELALDVFTRVDVTRFYTLTQRTFPGFDNLRPNAQAALVSLVFNRGASMAGPSRAEMRDLRDDAVPGSDYGRMAADFRKMKRLWPDTKGLQLRRDAEATLVLTP